MASVIQSKIQLDELGDALTLYGEIGASYDGITAERFGELLAGVRGGEIRIYVNSVGGDVFEAMAMVAQLKRQTKHIVCFVDGVAASAATLIAMAADRIVMSPGAMMMIHMPFSPCAEGTAEALRARADALEEITDAVVDLYSSRTNHSPEQIRAWMVAETWMNAQTALARGFCDAIEGVDLVEDFDGVETALGATGLMAPEELFGKIETIKPGKSMSANESAVGGASAICRRFRCAPANVLALLGQIPHTAARSGKEKQMKALMRSLGLPEDAGQETVLARVGDLMAFEKNVFELAQKNTAPEVLGVLAAHRAAAEQTQTLIDRVAAMEAEKQAAEIERIVCALKQDGKIVPAQENWARELGRRDVAQLKAFAETAPVVVAMRGAVQEPLPAHQAKPFAQMSVDEKARLCAESPELYERLRAQS